jgi:hypothetical protein
MRSKPRRKPPASKLPSQTPAWKVWPYIGGSAAILIPCFWQMRIQAGDLSSHLYNAWLAHLVEAGQAPGLVVAPQTTNVLFDLLLKALWEAFGSEAAQRIAVSLAVLNLVWGAFAFVRRVSMRNPWPLLPILAVLAYGWTFHTGLFNFYIGLGLCFWALSLAWEPSPRRLAGAAALIALAYTAHGLPVVWTLGVIGYLLVARRLTDRGRSYLMAGSLAVIVAGVVLIRFNLRTIWVPVMQFRSMLAGDQAWLYGDEYLIVCAGLVAIWGVLLAQRWRAAGARAVFGDTLVQICILTSAGILLVPTWIGVPGYGHPLVYLPDRMSLALGIAVCAVVGAEPVRPVLRYAIAGVALLFFGLAYADERVLNSLETRMETLVSRLPAGQRVVSGLSDQGRIGAAIHLIDRICVERCYSYGNYEPSSGQFRVRATTPNVIVAASDKDVNDLTGERYAVQSRDIPLFEVLLDARKQLVVVSLAPGQVVKMTPWK